MTARVSETSFRPRNAADVYDAATIQGWRDSGIWGEEILLDFALKHASSRPHDLAVVDSRGSVSWAELVDRAESLAQGMVALGLEPGDVVALQLPNWAEFVESYLACQLAGLPVLTLMTIYREHDLAYMLDKCGARAAIVPAEFRGFAHGRALTALKQQLPSLDHVIVVDGRRDDRDGLPYAGLAGAGTVVDLADRRPHADDVSHVSFTSGTTARPKAVVHTHNTDLTPPRWLAQVLGLGLDTPVWMPSPIAHTSGLLFGVHNAVLGGATLVLQDVWQPEEALRLISTYRATYTVSATPFIAAMVRVPDREALDLSSFRYFVSGGAPIPGELVVATKDLLGCELLRVFGHSEAPLHTINHPGDPLETLTSRDGRVIPGAEVKIVDPDDHATELPPGGVGEYATRGPHVFLGYWDEPELTTSALDPAHWFYSGDLCQKDENDYVTYVDRIKDIINRGGIKYSALEIETVLCGHPSVRQAAVVAVPDERLGEHAVAFVILEDGVEDLSLAELREYLEVTGVSKPKWPEELRIRAEFPQTATGKVQKAQMRSSMSSYGNA